MKKIDKLRKAFLDADAFFANKESNATSTSTRQFWADRRSINDQAYFILIFAQLEDHINVTMPKTRLQEAVDCTLETQAALG